MAIKTTFSISADGYVTTSDGWPSLIADPNFVSGKSHGFPEFQTSCEAVLMGRTTFEPALRNDRWPWPDLEVFVLGHTVPTAEAPVPIVTDTDPAALLEKLRAAPRRRQAAHRVGLDRHQADAGRDTPPPGGCCRHRLRRLALDGEHDEIHDPAV